MIANNIRYSKTCNDVVVLIESAAMELWVVINCRLKSGDFLIV